MVADDNNDSTGSSSGKDRTLEIKGVQTKPNKQFRSSYFFANF